MEKRLFYKDPSTGTLEPLLVYKVDTNAVSALLVEKQDKEDASLNTTSKTVVGAINELNTLLGHAILEPYDAGTIGQVLSTDGSNNYSWINSVEDVSIDANNYLKIKVGNAWSNVKQITAGSHTHNEYIPKTGGYVISGNIGPNADKNINLGSAIYRWNNVFSDYVNVDTAIIPSHASATIGDNKSAWATTYSSEIYADSFYPLTKELAINGDMVPKSNAAYSLGSNALHWDELHVNTANTDNIYTTLLASSILAIDVSSDLVPKTTNTINLGSAANIYDTGYFNRLIANQSVNSAAFIETSDINKKNIVSEIDLDKAYELIDKCSTIIYTLKDDPEQKEQIGTIAQEVLEFFPELIETLEDGSLSLSYSRLTVIIMKVLKDLINRVQKLENK